MYIHICVCICVHEYIHAPQSKKVQGRVAEAVTSAYRARRSVAPRPAEGGRSAMAPPSARIDPLLARTGLTLDGEGGG